MDTLMMEPTLGAVHVAIGGIAGAVLEDIAAPVLVEEDNLMIGPSSADVILHRSLRARLWGRAPSAELEKELARATGPILCVHLPPTPAGLLSLCRICDLALMQSRRVSVLELEPEGPSALSAGIDPGRTIYIDEAAILRGRPPAALWSQLQLAFAAMLWRSWCHRSPVAFSTACATGSALHPQLANLGRYQAGFFPRVSAQWLLLSRFDELVLRSLSGEWVTPSQVFLQAGEAGSALSTWLAHTGDLYLGKRLFAWAVHSRGRLVEHRKGPPANAHELTASSFRLRKGSEGILAALPSLRAAPKAEIGGAVAYSAERPWVCRADNSLGSYLMA
jgi:hypothetical protein